MHDSEKILAIIPARSGSKGIANKNIQMFAGYPLFVQSIFCAEKSNLFDDIVVSTNSESYADLAREYGATVPFLRPQELSGNTNPTSDVTLHVLHGLEKLGKRYRYFAVLQPTSPLRTPQDLRDSFALLTEKNADAVISVSQVHTPPQWVNTLGEDRSMKGFITKEARNKPRQALENYYAIHGAIFWARTEVYLQNQDSYALNSLAYIMPFDRSVDIDTIVEFRLAEILYTQSLEREKCPE